MIVKLVVATDYDVTGRTFPTGHMRVMPHTDMSALTLLFQRVGKPVRRCCACSMHITDLMAGEVCCLIFRLCMHPAPCSVSPWTQHPFPKPLAPITTPCTSTGLSPPPLLPHVPMLPCSDMILQAKGHHHKFCNNDFDRKIHLLF